MRPLGWDSKSSNSFPYDEELDFIRSNKDYVTYIDTGYVLKTYDVVDCTARHIEPGGSTYVALFGSRVGTYMYNDYTFFISYGGAGDGRTIGYSRTGKEQSVSMSENSKRKRRYVTNYNKAFIYENGQLINTITNTTTSINDCVNTCYLFAINGDSLGIDFFRSCQDIYDFSISDKDGNLIMHLKPVLSKSVPCFYDEVSKNLFFAQGSGHQFGYGKKDGTIIDPI